MSTIVDNHHVNISRTFNKYAVHLVAQESFDHSRGVYSEYKKKNKFAIEDTACQNDAKCRVVKSSAFVVSRTA